MGEMRTHFNGRVFRWSSVGERSQLVGIPCGSTLINHSSENDLGRYALPCQIYALGIILFLVCRQPVPEEDPRVGKGPISQSTRASARSRRTAAMQPTQGGGTPGLEGTQVWHRSGRRATVVGELPERGWRAGGHVGRRQMDCTRRRELRVLTSWCRRDKRARFVVVSRRRQQRWGPCGRGVGKSVHGASRPWQR